MTNGGRVITRRDFLERLEASGGGNGGFGQVLCIFPVLYAGSSRQDCAALAPPPAFNALHPNCQRHIDSKKVARAKVSQAAPVAGFRCSYGVQSPSYFARKESKD
jgi:hypothetical protein